MLIHKILLQGFYQRIAKWPVVVISKLLYSNISNNSLSCCVTGDLMEQMIPMMSCYSIYVQDHAHAVEAYFEVSKELKFKQFLEHLHSKPAAKGLLLSELLAVPLNRVSQDYILYYGKSTSSLYQNFIAKMLTFTVEHFHISISIISNDCYIGEC